ncbi:MAG: rod-binding protein [Candidatus Jidaibacter sp.]|jgi:hypothetical protein|nr:rod-binding protein [Candidatus Jidaibacter sp.]
MDKKFQLMPHNKRKKISKIVTANAVYRMWQSILFCCFFGLPHRQESPRNGFLYISTCYAFLGNTLCISGIKIMLCTILFTVTNTAHAHDYDTVSKRIAEREKEIETVAKDYESVMTSRILKSMFEGIKTDHIAGGGKTEKLYQELLLDEYAKAISKGDGIKLAQDIARDMKKNDTLYRNLTREQDELKKQRKTN